MPRYTDFWGDTIDHRIKWMSDRDLQGLASLINVNIALAVNQPHLPHTWLFIKSTIVLENGDLDPNLPTFLLDHTYIKRSFYCYHRIDLKHLN
uniref:Uncharacterized protein n=1 Tax=Panagrolaimus sp. JU765 TaxID=591449 RepID=A0AC34QC97_9BILA